MIPKIPKIVLAGAPYSGKTSTMKALMKKVSSEYLPRIKFIPEVASSIISEECPELATADKIKFQKMIFRRQCEEERNIDANIELIISDRAKPDFYIYLSDGEIESSEDFNGFSLNELLKEYDIVIFFEKSNDAYLEKEADTIRVEKGAEEMEIVTKRTREIWLQHHNVFCIQPFETVQEKTEFVAKLINDILQKDIFN